MPITTVRDTPTAHLACARSTMAEFRSPILTSPSVGITRIDRCPRKLAMFWSLDKPYTISDQYLSA
ncbi:hypothetical protein [Rhodococcus sp. 5A-K4]|uniref:hypothetical protein n=1 Tax=Rhodococcus sp. 5A-K4 TaxID=3384442 RepID=UPI0038D44894